MITRNTRQFQLLRGGTTVDKYGQLIKAQYSPIGTVDVFTSLYSDTNLANNPNYKEVTHIGIFYGENIFQEKDKLDDKFIVLKIVPCGRWTRLLLKEV